MVQVVRTKSWGSRIVSALWGMLFGLAMIIGAFILIFWNESHGLSTAQSLQEAEKIVIDVPASPIDPNNNGHVIHFSGMAMTNTALQDSLFGISETAIKLDRQVEMYQWEENRETSTESEVGGSQKEVTNYTYKMVWSSNVIDSSQFEEKSGHQNPTEMHVKPLVQYAKDVTVGDFTLPHDMVTQMTGTTVVDLSKVNLSKLEARVHKPVKVDNDVIYVGTDPDMPQVGDLKISLSTILPQTVSILAKQVDTTLEPYQAKAGQSVSLIVMGTASSEKMIMDELSSNRVITWLLRIVALVLMIIGLGLLMAPASVLADVVPFFGSLVSFGTGVIAFTVGLLLWSLAVAIAWFAVRPLWSIGIIIISLAIAAMVIYRRRSRGQVSQ